MGKQPTSTTKKEIPEWLAASLKPLLSGSAANLAQFSQQGNNILQGRPAGDPSQAGPAPGGQAGRLREMMLARGRR